MTRLHPDFLKAPIAHRGLHDKTRGVIENSILSIKAAIANGYGIEIDVQPAKDLAPMVFHDYLLDRLTENTGAIKGREVSELSKTPLKDSTDVIPTLEEVLQEVDGQVPLLVEIKDQDMRLGEDVGAFQDHVVAVLKDYTGPVALMSFSPETIRRVKQQAPEMTIGLVTDPFHGEDWPNLSKQRRQELAGIPDAKSIGVDFISHQQKDLASPHVADLKDAGLPILCWTIRSLEDEARARQIADNITFEGYLAPLNA